MMDPVKQSPHFVRELKRMTRQQQVHAHSNIHADKSILF